MTMEDKSQSFFKKYKSDIILIVVVIAVGLAALLIQRLTLKTGKTVLVVVSGRETEHFSLNEDITYKIEFKEDSRLSEEYNILVIRDGQAYISEATCSEQICVKHNAISNTGETIVCLPHKLTIEIK